MNDTHERRLRLQRNAAFLVAGVSVAVLAVKMTGDWFEDTKTSDTRARTDVSENGDAVSTRLEATQSVHQSTKPDSMSQGRRVGDSQNQNQVPPETQKSGSSLAAPSNSDLSGEHSPVEKFLANSGGQDQPAELNEKFDSESRDPEWAPHAEAQLQDYMARHPHASAYQEQWIECRQTLCQFYAEIEASMVQAIQQNPPGTLDPFAAMQHDSIAQELEQLGAAFNADDQSKRIAMLIPFRRSGEE